MKTALLPILVSSCVCSGTTPKPADGVAAEDGALSARVVARRTLRYEGGADATLDRPAHPRGASALHWFEGKLAVVQDDNNFIALLAPAGVVEPFALPPGDGGLRVFEERRGNKNKKWDLEAALVAKELGGEALIAFGSGSKKERERVVVLRRDGGALQVDVIEAHAWYARMRKTKAFAGSELNIEGIAWLDDERVRIFQRGNGDADGADEPIDAVAEVRWAALMRYLRNPDQQEPPALENVRRYDLGKLAGVRLTFTDGVRSGAGTLYLASAEASSSATEDGPTAGVVVGILDADGTARWTRLLDEQGAPLAMKAEGICLAEEPGRVYLVTDKDDPDAPTELLTVQLSGFAP